MSMDRAIFNMNLNVEATSLYILICALTDQGEMPTLDRIRAQWNGSEEGLFKAVEELIRHGIVNGALPPQDEEPLQPKPKEKWHWT